MEFWRCTSWEGELKAYVYVWTITDNELKYRTVIFAAFGTVEERFIGLLDVRVKDIWFA